VKQIATATIALAALSMAAVVDVTESRAGTYGDAPWCAVLDMGTGNIEWDCEFQTVEQCTPAVLAGNRGFCNHNPASPQYAPAPPVTHRKHHHG